LSTFISDEYMNMNVSAIKLDTRPVATLSAAVSDC